MSILYPCLPSSLLLFLCIYFCNVEFHVNATSQSTSYPYANVAVVFATPSAFLHPTLFPFYITAVNSKYKLRSPSLTSGQWTRFSVDTASDNYNISLANNSTSIRSLLAIDPTSFIESILVIYTDPNVIYNPVYKLYSVNDNTFKDKSMQFLTIFGNTSRKTVVISCNDDLSSNLIKASVTLLPGQFDTSTSNYDSARGPYQVYCNAFFDNNNTTTISARFQITLGIINSILYIGIMESEATTSTPICIMSIYTSFISTSLLYVGYSPQRTMMNDEQCLIYNE